MRPGGVKHDNQIKILVDAVQKAHVLIRPVNGGLVKLHSDLGDLHQFTGRLLALVHELVVRHDAVNHAQTLGLLGGDHFPGQEQFLGLGKADAERCDQDRGTGPKPDFRLTEHGLLGGNFNIAELGEFTRASQGIAVNRGDIRFAGMPDLEKSLDVGLQISPPAIRGAVVEFGLALRRSDIEPRGKRPAGSGQNHDPDSIIRLNRIQRLAQFGHQFLAERIELLRPVEGQIADGILLLKYQVLIRHSPS